MNLSLEKMPIGNGAGSVKSLDHVARACKGPMTRITVGSITVQPRVGNIGETYYFHPQDMWSLNSLGLPNPGMDAYKKLLPEMVKMAHGAGKLAQSIELIVRGPEMDKPLLEELKDLLSHSPGAVPVYLRLEMAGQAPMQLKLSEQFQVDPTPELLEQLIRLFGDTGVAIKRQPSKPPPSFNRPRFSSAASVADDE